MAKIKHINSINEQGSAALNEDAALINETDGVFGVFDGASSLVPYLSSDKKTGAYIASHIA